MNNIRSKVLKLALALGVTSCILASCKGKGGNDGEFPDDFATMNDAGKVAFVMRHAEPDSVARFIIDASLGRVEEVKIDTFANATLYAYEHYRGTELDKFAIEFESYRENLSLPDKMKVLAMAGEVNPDNMGFQLGLEYVARIRDKKMSVADVEKEIKAFQDACKDNPQTYERFMTGFRTVLELDRGKDLDEKVYQRFMNK